MIAPDAQSAETLSHEALLRSLSATMPEAAILIDRMQLRIEQLQGELAHVSRVNALGTLAASLAHELNQPLTAVANYVQTARHMLRDPNEEAIAGIGDALDAAVRQAVRAGQIVRGMREFVSRGSSEKQVEAISRLVEDARDLALIGVDAGEIRVVIDIDPEADLVFADPVAVEQVLVNLIRNAAEAMADSADRTLEIRAVPVDSALVRISVADNGPGIAPEIAARLFSPFVSSKTSGMGLGLSICRTIVEGQGGTIDARSSAGGGTVFQFTLIRARSGETE